jgi:Fe2+ transport system protein B
MGERGVVRLLCGREEFTHRMVALGFTPGVEVTVVQNYGHGPMPVVKGNTLATLGDLYGNDANLGLAEQVAWTLIPRAGRAFLVVQMTFIPCVATMAAIKQGTGSWKWPAFSVGLLWVISFGAAVIVNQFARVLGYGG